MDRHADVVAVFEDDVVLHLAGVLVERLSLVRPECVEVFSSGAVVYRDNHGAITEFYSPAVVRGVHSVDETCPLCGGRS